MVTLRPKSIRGPGKGNTQGAIIPFSFEFSPSLVLVKSIRIVPDAETVSLSQAEAIVSGGRGVKTAEGIQQLQGLVEALKKYFGKVELGASRPLVDEGIAAPFPPGRPDRRDSKSPALHRRSHIRRCPAYGGHVGSKKIIAINKDPEASIFEASDYGVVGQYEDIVPALIKKLEALP